jgi:ribose transport system ATP-binding protein
MVAIARALQDQEGAHEGVLVLDEPTASLPVEEVDVLLESLRRYAADGQTILYVSHRLDEVLDISDRVSVLRDGRHVGTVDTSDVNEARLVEMIVGRPLDRVFPEMPEVNEDEVVLEVHNLQTGPLVDVSFALKGREVLGIAGLLGSGRSELLQAIFGAQHIDGGEIVMNGRPVRFAHPKDAMEAGIAYVPEDRPADAAFADLSVRENLSAADVSQYFRGLRLRHRVERSDAQRSIRDFLVKTPTDAAPMATLSGGNQQKVILARWLRLKPSILLLDEPTQGVDVNARAEIYTLVRAAVEAGAAVIVVTSDFDELAHVCDRALVLRQGRVVAELLPPHITSDRLTELAYTAMEVPA